VIAAAANPPPTTFAVTLRHVNTHDVVDGAPIRVFVRDDAARTAAISDRQLPVAFVTRPARAGMYRLGVSGAQIFGFVRAQRMDVWFPDEAHGDADLRSFRSTYAGNLLYPYTHAVIECPPAPPWFALNSTDFRGIDAQRVSGTFLVYLGNSQRRPDDAVSFLAVDPIRLSVRTQNASCAVPVMVFADAWHAETTYSLRPSSDRTDVLVHTGMTRSQVVRTLGYPQRYGTPRSFAAESRWHYDFTDVRFTGDRVVAVRNRDLP